VVVQGVAVDGGVTGLHSGPYLTACTTDVAALVASDPALAVRRLSASLSSDDVTR
jgi:hypothetical protein